MFRTKDDLDFVVKENKPLKVIKIIFDNYQEGVLVQNFIDKVKDDYNTKYGVLDNINNCPDCLVYTDVNRQEVLDENGNIVYDETTFEPKTELVYTYEDEAYTTDEEGNKVLTEEASEKIEAGKVKPDLNKWVEWNLNGKEELNIEPFTPVCENCDEMFVDFIKPILLTKLSDLADLKHEEAEALITDKSKLTNKQLERYQIKLKLAEDAKANDDYSDFELEAKLTGMEAKDLVDLIITSGGDWKKAIDSFIILIEAYRVRAQKVIKDSTTVEDMFKIESLLKTANGMNAATKPEDIEALFANF